MWDFKLTKIFGLMIKTIPFILFRIIIYLGVAIGYLLLTGIAASIGYGIGAMAGNQSSGTGIGALIGFIVASAILYWLREYILYFVKAGHIAVLVELMDGGKLPIGKSQIEYGQAKVRERFVESSVLFGLDQLIKGILRALNRTVFTITAFLPIPGLQNIAGVINKVMNLSLTYTDEVIIAQIFRTGGDYAWQIGKDALVLYGQNYKTILKNAFFLMLFTWVLAFIIFLIILAPVGAIFTVFRGPVSIWGFLLAIIFTWSIKAALLEPFALTAMMQVYFNAINGQVPDPQWDEKLSSISNKFRKLKENALKAPATAL